MTWRRITEADILSRMSDTELTTFRSLLLGDNQEDPIDYYVDQITDLARGSIAGNAANSLGAAGTIPQKLIGPCVDLIVIEIMKRCGGVLVDPNDARKEAARTAMQILQRVEKGLFAIEEPDEVSDEVIGSPSPSISARPPRFKRYQQDGI
ncbi:MAG: hypothetical protein PHI93_11750 [Kiritimatiellae bacterium]|nr:hypothetical protein [Kiritimatiellia bacterium]